MENTECSIIKTQPSFFNLKVGVSLDHGVLLCFVSLLAVRTCKATSQAKNKIRNAPASSLLTLVLHPSHNVRTANCHLLYMLREKRRLKFCRAMMRTLELLQLAKKHISGRRDVEQWRNWGCRFSHYQVMLVRRHQ